MGRRRRRFWTDDEKRSICLQTLASGVSVAQVAHRYALNSNLIFKWLRDPRFSPASQDAETVQAGEARFLPVEIIDGGNCHHDSDTNPTDKVVPASHDGVLEIDLSGGHRLRVSGAYDADTLALLIRRLS